jgi:hypothetical protein
LRYTTKTRQLSGKQWAKAIADLNRQWSQVLIALLNHFQEREGITNLSEDYDREALLKECPERLRPVVKALLQQYHEEQGYYGSK